MSKQKILAQAAEAKIFLINNKIVKSRISKGYRLPFLDKKLRKQRTRKEAKLLQKAASLIPVPRILAVNETQSTIELEYVKGKKLSESLDTLPIEKTPLFGLADGVSYKFYHCEKDIHGEVLPVIQLADDDHVFHEILNYFNDREFPGFSPFLNGCVAISEKQKESK